jgi:predicted lactoylglutathione lyase
MPKMFFANLPVADLQGSFMYNRNLADPDGHVWEAMWMDLTAIPAGSS